MKNIVIDNQEFQVSPNKTKLESQIKVLKTQEAQIIKQLKTRQIKAKKANNLVNCLITANKFGSQFLTEAVESEKNQEQPNNWA
jgi:diphthamide synthase subunit DPH2